jgi:tetratricopeptide (TPR) repeat protein
MNKRLLLLFLLLPFLLPAQKNQNEFLDSLLLQLSEMPKDTNRVMHLDHISFTYSRINPDKGLKYAAEAKELSEQLKWKRGVASSYSDFAVNYAAKSENDKAIDHNLKSLKLYEELGMKRSMAGVMANLCLIYLAKGDHSQALEYAFKAEKIDEEFADKPSSAIIQENIGIIYMRQGNNSKAMEYYTKALKIQETMNNKEGEARILGNIGILHDAAGDYTKALNCYLKSLETNIKTGDKNSIQINYANIGNAYSHLHDFSKALGYHLHALSISRELGTKNDIAINLGNIGETYFFIANDTTGTIKPDSIIPKGRAANLQLAIFYLEQATALCKEIDFLGPLIEFEQFLSQAYYASGNYKSAYEKFGSYTAIKDSVFSQENNIHLKNLETRRELDLKDKEIIIQNKQIEISRLAAENKRNERLVFMYGTIVLLLIASFVIFVLVKRSHARKNALSDIAVLQSHQVRGPVARILGLAELFNKNEPFDPENKALIGHMVTATKELDEVVKKVVSKTTV